MIVIRKSAVASAIVLALCASPNVLAQQLEAAQQGVGSGGVRGRILNTTTGEYVRNAEIRVEGTRIVVRSGDGGEFRLSGVPAGQATVVVSYTGLQESRSVVTVAAGQVAALDISLRPAGGEGVDTINITGTRSGQAKALMERRASMNAKNVVSADNYGTLTMGDVGEFMKSMPGLSLDYTEVDATAVRIGGLDPKYSTFTTDGARMATATSNNNTGRQNSFEQMSITGIESIELNNTLTAAMDADSPGGNINLRSKYAFQRSGGQLMFQVGGVATSDSAFRPQYMPDDNEHPTIYPSLQLGAADIFLNDRLGVELNASYNANFVEQDRVQTDWAYKSDGTVMPYQVMWRPGPKMTHREAANLAVDYKLTDDLTLSLRSSYSFYDVEYFNQYTYLIFGQNNATPSTLWAAAGSTPTHIVVNPQGSGTTSPRLHTQYSHRYAGTPSAVFSPRLEYKGDTWEALLRGSYSSSEFNFRDNSRGFFQRTDSWLTRIGFTLDRASPYSNDWTLTQTAGRSWSDPRNFNLDDDIGNNIRTAQSDALNGMYTGNLDLKKKLEIADLPVTLLGGAGVRTNMWKTNEGSYQQFQYVGPNGDLTQKDPAAVIPWTENYQFEIHGFDAGNLNDQNWRADSNYGVYQIYQEHPEYFVPDTLGNAQRILDNNKKIQEQVNSLYVEGQTDVGRARFDLGLRYESTETEARVADVRSLKDVLAALGPSAVTGATAARPWGTGVATLDALLYRYNNATFNTRKGEYDDFFLSGGVKYDFTDKLVGQLAFSQSILRPDYGNLGGVTSVNDDTLIVTVPNSELKPEHSTKYFAGLQYFLEPAGVVGVSVYQLEMEDMQVTGITVNPEDVGYAPDEYAGYTFRSAANLPGVSINRGATLEYSQQLDFLPGPLSGFSLYGSSTWISADGKRVNTPAQAVNAGVRYAYGPFDVQLNGNWQAKYRQTGVTTLPNAANNGILYHADRELWNLSAGYKLNDNFQLIVAGRNIFNEPDVVYSNVPERVQLYSIYGAMWNVGIRGSF